MMSRKTRFFLLIIVGSFVTAVDQYTKFLVTSQMELFDSIEIVPGYFSLTYLLNPGGAFGIFADYSKSFRIIFFIVISIIALLLFVFMLMREPVTKDNRFVLAMIFITGGALGNIIDRVLFGKVVDFLDFYISGHHWPPFNVADSAITLGMFFFMLHSFIPLKKEPCADDSDINNSKNLEPNK